VSGRQVKSQEMRRPQMQAKRLGAVVQLVQEKQRRLGRVAADIKLMTTGLGLHRLARVVHDCLAKNLHVGGLDVKLNDDRKHLIGTFIVVGQRSSQTGNIGKA
jgi:hypothetical protein